MHEQDNIQYGTVYMLMAEKSEQRRKYKIIFVLFINNGKVPAVDS